MRDLPEFRDARLVSEVRRLHEVAHQFRCVSKFGVTSWEGIYIEVPREDLATLRAIYPDDDDEDLADCIESQFSEPMYLLEFALCKDGNHFLIRSQSPYFSILFDLSKDLFLVPPVVMTHDRFEDFKTVVSEIVPALQRSLEEALTDGDQYRARIKRGLPFENRIGRIKRSELVEAGLIDPTSLNANEVAQFLQIAPTLTRKHPLLLSRDDYLYAVQIALSAVGKARVGEPLTKSYKDNADGRDGGLLRLSPTSADDFYRWLIGRDWQGQHPFEIVRGFHSNTGIRLFATPHQRENKVELTLCGAWEGVAEKTVRMALALHDAGIPITLSDLEFHKARVHYEDWLVVSSSSGFHGEDWRDIEFDNFNGIVGAQISYWELVERPSALQRVAWKDPVIIQPLSK
jgi:hypothetical protein